MNGNPVSELLAGPYPERPDRATGTWTRALHALRDRWRRRHARGSTQETATHALGLDTLRARLAIDPTDPLLCDVALDHAASACAVALGIDPYPGQLACARALLRGDMAEMATGEGKTLAVALAAACGALAGRPVHVVTANDYLAMRDCQAMAPLYTALGLSCDHVTGASEPARRRTAYDADITYAAARELVFDGLRDRILAPREHSALGARLSRLGETAQRRRTLLRGLWMAIVDEADSVLLDEAVMPFVMSAPDPTAEPVSALALALEQARALVAGRDFRLDVAHRRAWLTPIGRATLGIDAAATSGFRTPVHQVEHVETALAADALYQRDRDYLVRDGAVVIIDETTGRASPGRVWARHLHALICLKEGCTPPAPVKTLAQTTFQAFFSRYLHLCGTSGTLLEARRELGSVYGTPVTRIPRRRPSTLARAMTRLFVDASAHREAVVARILELHTRDRPVLVGMDSVAEADALAARLRSAGIAHQVLHARQDSAESALIARAGEAGAVTVTTRIAGRGTDIRLDEGAARAGGLHVIVCQRNRSRRIDRQLVGRAARQGDPGSCEHLISVARTDAVQGWPAWMPVAARLGSRLRRGRIADWLIRLAQARGEREGRAIRQALLDREIERERELDLGAHP